MLGFEPGDDRKLADWALLLRYYQALAKAVSADPILAADPEQQTALQRAHARWSEAFVAWDGR